MNDELFVEKASISMDFHSALLRVEKAKTKWNEGLSSLEIYPFPFFHSLIIPFAGFNGDDIQIFLHHEQSKIEDRRA